MTKTITIKTSDYEISKVPFCVGTDVKIHDVTIDEVLKNFTLKEIHEYIGRTNEKS